MERQAEFSVEECSINYLREENRECMSSFLTYDISKNITYGEIYRPT